MPTTTNGDVEIYYETIGNATDPVLLLVNGLGSQCINFKTEFCEKFAAEGFYVVRFDNRDVGLSTHLPDGPHYDIVDMAKDCIAILDAIGAEKAHIAGWSMGGMISQQVAIQYPDRLLSLTSVMSSPGGLRKVDPDVLEAFTAPAPKTREEFVAAHIKGISLWGSPAFQERDRITENAELAFDRCFDPKGQARQAAAIGRSPNRTEALANVKTPTLVIHGDADRLVDPEAGRDTAAAIPGARFELVGGMGHDYPPQVWDTVVGLIAPFAHAAV